MFGRHQAEITAMQFRGHSLPVHQSMSVSWAFTLSHFVCQIRLRDFFRLLAIGMCHFLPVHHFEMACLAGSKFKIQQQDTLEEHVIKFCFKLGKMPQKRMECFRLLFDHLAWIEHEFLSRIRDSRKARSLWGMMRGVGGVKKSIHQSWLAKGLGLLCWGFNGVQEEIPSEEASSLQIGSEVFPPGQYSIHDKDYLSKIGIKTVPHPPYSADLAPCDFCLFPKLRGCRYETIEEMKEAVTKVIDTLTQEDFHGAFQKLLERYNKCIAAEGD